MSMKAKLGQPQGNNQNKTFVPGTPSNNRTPAAPANQAPTTPTK
jgi:hypothetical protein